MKKCISLILLSLPIFTVQARNFVPNINSSIEVISNITYTVDCSNGMQDTFLSILSKEHIWFTQINETWGPNVYNTRYKIDTFESSIQNKNYSHVLSSDSKTGDDWRQTSIFVRESDGKLWLIDTTIMTQEICILDMNLDVGDQFSLTDSVLGFDNKLSVYKVDSIIDLNGQLRKVIYLSCDGGSALQYRWIEGIGPEIGIFSTSFQHCIIDGNISGLTCFYISDALAWYNENYSQCWYSLVDTDMDASATWWDASFAGEW